LSAFKAWILKIKGFISQIWQLLEELFETIQKKRTENYASLNAKRLFGYPAILQTEPRRFGRRMGGGGGKQWKALQPDFGTWLGCIPAYKGRFDRQRRDFLTSFCPLRGSIPRGPIVPRCGDIQHFRRP
jgi:hypothetical protein